MTEEPYRPLFVEAPQEKPRPRAPRIVVQDNIGKRRLVELIDGSFVTEVERKAVDAMGKESVSWQRELIITSEPSVMLWLCRTLAGVTTIEGRPATITLDAFNPAEK